MDDLKIRDAREEDFEDVMNLSVGVYNGLDYLPAIYHTYIREASVDQPRRLNYVAYLEEEMVGFFSIIFNFDFSNYLVSALRVSSRHRKLGIGMSLLAYYEKCGPRVKPGMTQMTTFANFVMSDHLLARVLQSQVRRGVQISSEIDVAERRKAGREKGMVWLICWWMEVHMAKNHIEIACSFTDNPPSAKQQRIQLIAFLAACS